MGPFTVQVDQSRTPRARRGEYPPAGPVAEGAGDGLRAAEPDKGGAKKRVFLVLSGLLVLAAVICGIGYLVFIRDTGDSTSSTASEGLSDSAVVSERGEAATAPGSVSPGPESVSADSDSDYTLDDNDLDSGSTDQSSPPSAGGGNSNNTTASSPWLGASGNATANGTAAASANVTAPVLKTVPVNAALGSYDEAIELSVIPVAIAVLPSGKVLAWSAESPDDFYRDDRYIIGGGGTGKTYFSIWDPATSAATSLLVANTNHDMFCPGITMMPNGDLIITGGQNANRTSIYQLAKGTFVQAPDMAISRGYGSSCLLSNGKVFVLGGSWSGPSDLAKDAELYDPTVGKWSNLPGIQAAFILTDDPEDAEEGRNYRADNYGMFHSWSDGTVFHAGPSTTMFWFTTEGEGSALNAGTRPGGNIANGNSVMYAKGKILNCGGSEAFALEEYPATNAASVITISQPNVQVSVREIAPMQLPRVFGNGVVLPDGKVLVTGGASHPKEFSDEFAHYQPEIWDPETEEWTLLDATHVYGRTYHSTGALLPDGRVVTGGGGLCGSGNNGEPSLCEGPVDPNHLNIEVFNPPYLFTDSGQLAPRPTIKLSAGTANYGASIQVTSSEQLMMISMIRMGSATHSTNTDQRRLELCGPYTSPCTGSPVTVTIDEDPGIALAGNWMIFGVNAKGVPSEASILQVGAF